MAVHQKSVFPVILGGKICILPNLKVKKSVYTDKISMSGRSIMIIITNSIIIMVIKNLCKALSPMQLKALVGYTIKTK